MKLTSLMLLLCLANLNAEQAAESKNHTKSFNEIGKRHFTDAQHIPRLVDLKKRKTGIVPHPDFPNDPTKLLPKRLYKRWEPDAEGPHGEKGGWVYDITDENGEFVKPPRSLTSAPPSTIPGPWAGGDEDTWYIFDGETAEMTSWSERPVVNPKSGWMNWVRISDGAVTSIPHKLDPEIEKRR